MTFIPSTRLAALALAASLGGLAAAAHAQPSGVLLRGAELREDALVQALLPPLPEGTQSRTLRPVQATTPRPPAAGGGAPVRPQAARPSSASVLVTFETNSAELNQEARRQLDVVARALNNEQLATMSFAIEGHADPRGSSEENLRLSQERADNVRAYLVSVGQIRPERLAAVGKGDSEPVNVREVAAPENRRVTFVTRAQ